MADIFEIVGKVTLDGIDKAEKELNSFTDTGEKSSSKLSKFGSVAKSVGKGLLISTGAVVTGAIGLIKQVSSSYGELQQSVGGIETLFGAGGKSLEEYAKSVGKTSSEVKLITSDDINFKVSVAIKTNNDDNYAILNGYNKKNGLIKASDINKSTEINKGDVVLTSGLGELIPAGIYIGTVEKIESDKYNLSKNVYIKTYQDFDDIHYVTVLKVKE